MSNNKNKLKEELNEVMHAEFKIPREVQYRNSVWNAMDGNTKKSEVLNLLRFWDVPEFYFERYKNTFPTAHVLKD